MAESELGLENGLVAVGLQLFDDSHGVSGVFEGEAVADPQQALLRRGEALGDGLEGVDAAIEVDEALFLDGPLAGLAYVGEAGGVRGRSGDEEEEGEDREEGDDGVRRWIGHVGGAMSVAYCLGRKLVSCGVRRIWV